MSLLIDALKKAERAKQGIRSNTEPANTAGLTDHSLNKEADLNLMTEALSKDALEAKNALGRETKKVISAAPKISMSQQRGPQLATTFRIKQNPSRRLLYLGVIVLVAITLIALYVWRTLQALSSQPIPTVNVNRTMGAKTVASPPIVANPAPIMETKVVPVVEMNVTTPEAKQIPTSPVIVADTERSKKKLNEEKLREKKLTKEKFNNAVPRPNLKRESIKIYPTELKVDPAVEKGYAALTSGDFLTASRYYQEVLQADSYNQDALLGLAAIALNSGEFNAARSYYVRLLEIDPKNTRAIAGLVGLHKGQIDSTQTESRIKNLLATQPQAHHLYFTLGNEYASQSRWGEAQQAYFLAYSSDPNNADYVFNLAVSLDQLHQNKLALQYYQKALSLAERQPKNFNVDQARSRVQELEKK